MFREGRNHHNAVRSFDSTSEEGVSRNGTNSASTAPRVNPAFLSLNANRRYAKIRSHRWRLTFAPYKAGRWILKAKFLKENGYANSFHHTWTGAKERSVDWHPIAEEWLEIDPAPE